MYTESHQDNTRELLEQLEKLVPESGLGISEQERDMVVKAMQLAQGHWFKCPKGKANDNREIVVALWMLNRLQNLHCLCITRRNDLLVVVDRFYIALFLTRRGLLH